MDGKSRAEKLGDVMTFLQEDCRGDLSIGDVCKLAELMVGSTQSFFASLDSVIYSEFRELSAYIENAQNEISALQANELHQQKIPDAGKQLDAIVKSTEEATNRIMEQAETIMAANPLDMESYQETVNNAVMEIFEACSFQDLTGQRISKVVETLQHIEQRVSKFAAAVKAKDGEVELSEQEIAKAKRAADQLLHGPQFEGEGVSQSMVDELLAGGAAAVAAEAADAEAAEDTAEPSEETDEAPVIEEPVAAEAEAAEEDPKAEEAAAAEAEEAAKRAAAEKAAAEKAAEEAAAAKAEEEAAAEKAAAEKAAAEKAAVEKAAAAKAAAVVAAEAEPAPEVLAEADAGKENSQEDIDALFG